MTTKLKRFESLTKTKRVLFAIPLLVTFAFPFVFSTVNQLNAESKKQSDRPRARQAGIEVGILPTGGFNAITDVRGIQVGHKTIVRGNSIRTGVTVILPHSDNIYQEKVPAAVYLGNAYGKLAGSTQIEELGEIETPIALTNTLSVSTAMRALIKWTLDQPGNEHVRSVNAIAGETNDGYLNDIRGLHVTESDVRDAIRAAKPGIVTEGNVGAGTGTVCFGFKGGIGTSSRVLPAKLGGYTIGVLVQTNYGGILRINGTPVGRELGKFFLSRYTSNKKLNVTSRHDNSRAFLQQENGSCMVVVATDAPLSSRNLKRLAKRAILGLGRTGSIMSNGSGDFVIAFSTAYRVSVGEKAIAEQSFLANSSMSPLFLAVVEATEEAVYNSLFKAETMTGYGGRTISALPLEKTISICKRYNTLELGRKLPSILLKQNETEQQDSPDQK